MTPAGKQGGFEIAARPRRGNSEEIRAGAKRLVITDVKEEEESVCRRSHPQCV